MSDIDYIVALLCDGDITKRHAVLWDVCLSEIDQFLEIQKEKIKFRKAVLAFLGVKEDKEDYTDEEYIRAVERLKNG